MESNQEYINTVSTDFVPTIGSFLKEITDFGPMFMTFLFLKTGSLI